MKKAAIRLLTALLLCLLPAAAFAAEDAVRVLVVSPKKLTLTAEETYALEVSAKDGGSLPQLIWASSDPEVADVDADGTVTALKRGSAKITVSSADGSTDASTCKVTVKKRYVKPVKAVLEGNIYDSGYNRVSADTEAAVRAYCERLGTSRTQKMMRKAVEYVGTSYDRMDCSKLTQAVYRSGGVRLPRVSDDQAKAMLRYARQDGVPRQGDLLFMQMWEGEACSCGSDCRRYERIHHSALYLGEIGGRTYMVDSSSLLGCVVIREFRSGIAAGMPVVLVAGK